MAEENTQETASAEVKLTKEQQALVASGCKAYGIGAKHVLAAGIDPLTGAAVIVTAGGSKVRFTGAKDEKVEPLSAIAVTGIPPQKKRK